MKKILITFIFIVFSAALGADTLTGSTNIGVYSDLTSDAGVSFPRDETRIDQVVNFVSGTGTETTGIDLIYRASVSIASGGSASLDFSGGLTNAFGATLTFARIKALFIKNTSTTQTLTIGNDANPIPLFSPATATVSIPPGGALFLSGPYAGHVVTAGTGDTLKISNSSGATGTLAVWAIGSSL